MYTITFLPHLKHYLKFATFIGFLPFEWDSFNENLIILQSKRKRFTVKLQMLTQLLHSILQLTMIIFSPYTYGKKLQAMTFSGIYITGTLLRWNWTLDDGCMGLLNALINFERTFFKGKSITFRTYVHF